MSADKAPLRTRNGGTCVGCGAYHGPVSERLDCLARALEETRALLEEARAALAGR